MSKHAIAICDVVGFSELVRKKPLDTVVQDHLGWLRKAAYHSIHKGEFPSDLPPLQALRDQSHLGVAWFSDTILIYTLEDTDDTLRTLTSTLGWLLFETVLEADTRLRSGVSYGEVFIDAENSIYVGQPLIQAYLLEQAQEWSGGALTREVVERLPADARTGENTGWFLVPYCVPLKGGKTLETLAINWTIGAHHDLKLRWSQTHATPPKEEWERRPDVCEKWQNTRLFHERVCKFCSH